MNLIMIIGGSVALIGTIIFYYHCFLVILTLIYYLLGGEINGND